MGRIVLLFSVTDKQTTAKNKELKKSYRVVARTTDIVGETYTVLASLCNNACQLVCTGKLVVIFTLLIITFLPPPHTMSLQ